MNYYTPYQNYKSYNMYDVLYDQTKDSKKRKFDEMDKELSALEQRNQNLKECINSYNKHIKKFIQK